MSCADRPEQTEHKAVRVEVYFCPLPAPPISEELGSKYKRVRLAVSCVHVVRGHRRPPQPRTTTRLCIGPFKESQLTTRTSGFPSDFRGVEFTRIALGSLRYLLFHNGEYRSDLISEHVGVCSGRQPLARHGDDVQALGELIEKVRMR